MTKRKETSVVESILVISTNFTTMRQPLVNIVEECATLAGTLWRGVLSIQGLDERIKALEDSKNKSD